MLGRGMGRVKASGGAAALVLLAATSAVAMDDPQAEIARLCAPAALTVDKTTFAEGEVAGGTPFLPAGQDFAFLTEALGTVCVDAALKADFAAQVKEIRIAQAIGMLEPLVTLTGGVLRIDYFWQIEESSPEAGAVADAITARLKGEGPEAP